MRAHSFSKREAQLAMYSSRRAGGGGINVTMMPNRSRVNKAATPPFASAGWAGFFLGLTGPANEDGFGRATEDEGSEGAGALDGCGGRDWRTVSLAKMCRTRAAIPGSLCHCATGFTKCFLVGGKPKSQVASTLNPHPGTPGIQFLLLNRASSICVSHGSHTKRILRISDPDSHGATLLFGLSLKLKGE